MTNETSNNAEIAAVAAQSTQFGRRGAGSSRGRAKRPKPAKPPKAGSASKSRTKAPAPKGDKSKPAQGSVPREGSKTKIVIEMLHCHDGATLAEIAKATGWQEHSVRGFISGIVSKKMALEVESAKNAAGQRAYRIK